ncbi:MAG: hypothetical protein ACREJ3_06420, partial [Polyangiaceae bacterium]
MSAVRRDYGYTARSLQAADPIEAHGGVSDRDRARDAALRDAPSARRLLFARPEEAREASEHPLG